MEHDTLESVFVKARDAQRRGLNTVDVVLPAERRTMAMRVDAVWILTDGRDSGGEAIVVRRFRGTEYRDAETGLTLDGRIETLLCRASVADMLEAGRRSMERALLPPRPVRHVERRRSLAHLTSR